MSSHDGLVGDGAPVGIVLPLLPEEECEDEYCDGRDADAGAYACFGAGAQT